VLSSKSFRLPAFLFAYETLTARSEINNVRPAWSELTNGSFARPFIQPAWFEAWSSAFPYSSARAH
jgi:CelD/BcsL family acetyltransferase involved in cellulose biosynthesis